MTVAADSLSEETIRPHLRTRVLGRALSVFPEVDSTNRVAAELAQAGAVAGTVVVAESQHRGRGRLGRQWFSPPGMNLYLSILLDPPQAPADASSPTLLTWVPLLAGLATAQAIHTLTSLAPRLKWPNDVRVQREGHSRKVGGILTEVIGGTAGVPRVVVLGIGVNANMPADIFPEDLRTIATSLLVETGRPVDRARLLASLLLNIEQWYARLLQHGPSAISEAYCQASETLGKPVAIILQGSRQVTGIATGLAPDGALQLKSPDGSTVEVRAGDIVHLRA